MSTERAAMKQQSGPPPSIFGRGPMGGFGLLYSPMAMIIAQTVLITPIVAALGRQTIEDLKQEYDEQLRALGVGPLRAVPTLLWDGRFSLLTACLAGFGRATAEVGAVIVVGRILAIGPRVVLRGFRRRRRHLLRGRRAVAVGWIHGWRL